MPTHSVWKVVDEQCKAQLRLHQEHLEAKRQVTRYIARTASKQDKARWESNKAFQLELHNRLTCACPKRHRRTTSFATGSSSSAALFS